MNQHYVPRVYLKNFAIQRGKNYFVDVFDKLENRFFPTNIMNICAETHFYTLQEGSSVADDVMAIENLYASEIEPMYAQAYKLLTDDSLNQISKEQKKQVIYGVLQLHFRNPAILKTLIDFTLSRVSEFCLNAKAKGDKGISILDEDYSFREWEEESIKSDVIKHVVNSFKEEHFVEFKKMADFHMDAKLEVYKLEDNEEGTFFASDNPLLSIDLIKPNWSQLTREKEFVLPLNKKYVLKIMHDISKESNWIYRQHTENGYLTSINGKILDQSQRFIITNKKGLEYFEYIKAFLNPSTLDGVMKIFTLIEDAIKDVNHHPELKQVLTDFLNEFRQEGTPTTEQIERFALKSKLIYNKLMEKRIQ